MLRLRLPLDDHECRKRSGNEGEAQCDEEPKQERVVAGFVVLLALRFWQRMHGGADFEVVISQGFAQDGFVGKGLVQRGNVEGSEVVSDGVADASEVLAFIGARVIEEGCRKLALLGDGVDVGLVGALDDAARVLCEVDGGVLGCTVRRGGIEKELGRLSDVGCFLGVTERAGFGDAGNDVIRLGNGAQIALGNGRFDTTKAIQLVGFVDEAAWIGTAGGLARIDGPGLVEWDGVAVRGKSAVVVFDREFQRVQLGVDDDVLVQDQSEEHEHGWQDGGAKPGLLVTLEIQRSLLEQRRDVRTEQSVFFKVHARSCGDVGGAFLGGLAVDLGT
mmetsp:Transcript_11563/g.33253  ORF Transcript_11563/g.33253 Transcript_11563/m.33253 type:complete len:332 (+) Transcript_11563:738-1733(+)